MNEQQFNAIRSCELSAAKLARKNGLKPPHFMFPNGDMSIEFRKAVEAIAAFMEQISVEPEPVETKQVEVAPAKKKKVVN